MQLASEFPPGLKDFDFKPLWQFELFGVDFEITKATVLTWLSVVIIATFFLLAIRKPKMVPGRLQWAGESVYGFVRDGMTGPMLGEQGVRFAPYLTTLFCFILVNNLYGIIPVAQISPTSKISLPAVLAIISLIVFNWVGIRQQGAGKYFRNVLFPPGAPWWIYPLLTPIELISVFIVRPVTLAVRLFANMFAGHLLLLVFTLGGVVLLTSGSLGLQTVSIFSFLLAIVLSLFEFVVMLVQAYVFTVLTASYVQGALSEAH